MEAESRISQVTQAAEVMVSDAQSQAQSMISLANLAADARVSEAQSKANSAAEEIQNQAPSRIQSLESSLQQQVEENRQLKSLMESMQQDFRLQLLALQARNSRIESLENRVQSQPQAQGQSSTIVDQVQHAMLRVWVCQSPQDATSKPQRAPKRLDAPEIGGNCLEVHNRGISCCSFPVRSCQSMSIGVLVKEVLSRVPFQHKSQYKNLCLLKGDFS